MNRCVSFLLFLFVLATALPNFGFGVSIEKAESYYKQARVLYEKGEYEGALDLFIKAYETYPQAKYVFNIANCYIKLGNLPRALDAYETFTQYQPTPEILKRVEREVAKLKSKLRKEYVEVFISTSPLGARIIIDDISKQNIYTSPVRRWLKEGKHSIVFQIDGYLPRQLDIDVKKGESIYIFAGLRAQ